MFAISTSESLIHWGRWIRARANVLGLKIWWCPFFCFPQFPLNFKVKPKFSIFLLNFSPLGLQNHISPLPYVSCVSNICCVFREYRWFSMLYRGKRAITFLPSFKFHVMNYFFPLYFERSKKCVLLLLVLRFSQSCWWRLYSLECDAILIDK
jgi:hypothetical protein